MRGFCEGTIFKQYNMKKLELIEELETVQENIEKVERQIAQRPSFRHVEFGKMNEYYHIRSIRTRALAYWKRRFNRILLKLGYYL